MTLDSSIAFITIKWMMDPFSNQSYNSQDAHLNQPTHLCSLVTHIALNEEKSIIVSRARKEMVLYSLCYRVISLLDFKLWRSLLHSMNSTSSSNAIQV